MSRHPPKPKEPPPEINSPVWAPAKPDPDLDEASTEDPALRSWMSALASQGQATMDDNIEDQLYSQAPDILRRTGIDPTDEAIEAWVTEQMRRPHS